MRTPHLIPLLILTALLISCGKSGGGEAGGKGGGGEAAGAQGGGEATVKSITLNRAGSSDAVETLSPGDNPFEATIVMSEAGAGKVKADLVAVDAGGEKNKSVVAQEYDLAGLNNTVDMKFSLPRDWPTGSYRIDVTLNGKKVGEKAFTIQ